MAFRRCTRHQTWKISSPIRRPHVHLVVVFYYIVSHFFLQMGPQIPFVSSRDFHIKTSTYVRSDAHKLECWTDDHTPYFPTVVKLNAMPNVNFVLYPSNLDRVSIWLRWCSSDPLYADDSLVTESSRPCAPILYRQLVRWKKNHASEGK